MCCSTNPPPGVMVLYILIVGVLQQVFLSNGIYVVGPANVKLLNVNVCSGVESKSSVKLRIFEYNDTAQLISGTALFPYTIDNSFKVTLRGLKFEDGEWISDKVYISNKSLCKIIDNYVWEMGIKTNTRVHGDSMCPILGGVYDLQNISANFETIEFPAEMFGHMKFLLQIEAEGEVYLCQELEFENSLKYQELV